MPHNTDIIFTLTGCLTAALCFGFITQKMKLSPILGYLLAGMVVGPFSPGFVADTAAANQFAEIGVVLLMFGVGLHFHLKDLIAVKPIALPGAVAQILVSSILGMLLTHFLGWSWIGGAIFGTAIAVASTVVLTRVLADNRALHTPIGHVAIGWLIVEDLFTIFVLVLLPAFFSVKGSVGNDFLFTFAVTIFKVSILIVFMLVFGKRILPKCLEYISRTGTRDLFTLAVLVIALGIAVGAANFFGASMALGAFLAGMVVGQSDFSARAASEALPMRDAFAVLFFVSVGMLFNPNLLASGWPLILVTLFIVLVAKPLIAVVVMIAMKQPLKKAISIGVALAQIGEFSFMLALLGSKLGIVPVEANNAIIFAAVVSIAINPLLYKAINPFVKWLEQFKCFENRLENDDDLFDSNNKNKRVILIGYGPVGQKTKNILTNKDLDLVVVEMNLDTVRKIRDQNESGVCVIHGDASKRDVLERAGVENAEAIIISSPDAPALEIAEVVAEINSRVPIFAHTKYVSEAKKLKKKGVQYAFSGEGTVALTLTCELMKQLDFSDDEISAEYRKINDEVL